MSSNHEVSCAACNGTGEGMSSHGLCPSCNGTGIKPTPILPWPGYSGWDTNDARIRNEEAKARLNGLI